MVGNLNTLRKIGGKLAVNMCYILTADVTVDSFFFQAVNISQVINYIILLTGFEVNSGTNFPRFFWIDRASRGQFE